MLSSRNSGNTGHVNVAASPIAGQRVQRVKPIAKRGFTKVNQSAQTSYEQSVAICASSIWVAAINFRTAMNTRRHHP